MIVIDAKDCIVGRLATFAAKKALQGEEVRVINSEKAIISGEPAITISKYLARRTLVKVKATPEFKPKWPRRPDLLLRRIIRGMLPFDKPRGRAAYRRVKCYIGVPKELESAERIKVGEKKVKKWMSILELCKALGWQAR